MTDPSASEHNPNTIGASLDDLFGVWSQDEEESFDTALEVFETVDESAWAEENSTGLHLPLNYIVQDHGG